jgi:hypothetical protein
VAHGRCLHRRHLGNPLDIQMRPLYETESNLEKERSLALFFEQTFECTLRKLPIRYHLDFAIERSGQIVGFVEVKVRNHTFEQIKKMGGYKLSFGKWCAAEQMCRVSGCAFVLLIGFTDQVRYARIDDFQHDGLVWWGRQDRGDAQDMEPAVVISSERFVMVR